MKNMKYAIFMLLLIGFIAQTGSAQIQAVKLEGYYLPKNMQSDVKSNFKEFKSFEHLALSSTSAKNINGFIVTKSGSFKILAPKLRGAEFSFTTVAIKRISYSFAGNFKMTDFSKSTEESEILSGVLFKHRNGKIIAEVNVDFDYWVGD
jgi:hypothetical protein